MQYFFYIDQLMASASPQSWRVSLYLEIASLQKYYYAGTIRFFSINRMFCAIIFLET